MTRMTVWLLPRWLLTGEWRAHPLRALVALAAIAVGVSLGFAIDLINGAAFNEFSAAVRSLSGQSDLQVRGIQPDFDETIYPRLAMLPGVALASPVLEIEASVVGSKSLKILGTDVFQASQIAPDLIGVTAQDKPFDTLADDAIFLSPAAQSWLQVGVGDMLSLQVGTQRLALRVAGSLVRARAGQRIGVMDIGAAQWRFGRIGKISWVDLKLAPGIDRASFRKNLPTRLQAAVVVTELADQEARTDNMSRAYRVNLNVLALVALFTGAFLVFSTQALSVIRRRSQLALLRVMGMTRRQLLAQVLLEGALLGVLGALLGLAIGYAMAAAALHFFGGDLGGGYFPGVQPSVNFDVVSAIVFFILGTAIAVLGTLAPAWEAANATLAPALKAGSEDTALSRLASPWPGLACLAAGGLMTLAPPVFELPLLGYAAVALILIGGMALMPRLAAGVFSTLAQALSRRMAARHSAPPGALPTLVLARLANAPNQASIALGGILSSFSLMVAMAIMVTSFRVSVDDWLGEVLAADLYVRATAAGDAGLLKRTEQVAIATLPQVARADFLRTTELTLDPTRPAVALIAREIDLDDPAKALPITGVALTPLALRNAMAPRGEKSAIMPAWVSEAMVDLYGYEVGKEIELSVGSNGIGGKKRFVVAGIWRDYVRQSGAIQIRLSDYQALTGEREINDVALRLNSGVTPTSATAALRALPFGGSLTITAPDEIRALSLKIFDRSFAVTYLLEAVAVVIGLFGIAATFSAQTLARAHEFGMLRHIGVTRRQIFVVLAAEGAMLTGIGILAGFAAGFCISLILVFIVNPQSFHWTMQLHIPWRSLLIVASSLLVAAALTALFAGRAAVSGQVLRAVREDW
ncbi:MAG: ABC transporter permease [Pseudomonadota bacterium]